MCLIIPRISMWKVYREKFRGGPLAAKGTIHGSHRWSGRTIYGRSVAMDGPAGPSMATTFAIDGPAGPVVAGDRLQRDR